MGYKTILVHCDANPKVAHRLAVAVELAKRHGAYLVGVHIQEPFDAPAMFNGTEAMDSLFAVFEETAKANLASAKAAFAQGREGHRAFDRVAVRRGYIDARLTVHARYADLTVLGQADPEEPSLDPRICPKPWRCRPAGRSWWCRISARRQGREDRHAVLERQPRERARRFGRPAAVACGGQGHRARRRSPVVHLWPRRRAWRRRRRMAVAPRRQGDGAARRRGRFRCRQRDPVARRRPSMSV